ncbi:hypothetical protein [Deinococcus aluminii]|uniref:hypothetical protein n=1 Tax=Deinococcus aluminii TaxID=1656885 RepID=UPI0031E547BB
MVVPDGVALGEVAVVGDADCVATGGAGWVGGNRGGVSGALTGAVGAGRPVSCGEVRGVTRGVAAVVLREFTEACGTERAVGCGAVRVAEVRGITLGVAAVVLREFTGVCGAERAVGCGAVRAAEVRGVVWGVAAVPARGDAGAGTAPGPANGARVGAALDGWEEARLAAVGGVGRGFGPSGA